MRQLLLATRNAHKTREVIEILGDEFEITDLSRAPDFELPPEAGATFAENAMAKAVAASKYFRGYAIGDDSGLEVDALGGAPGIYSARYAGPNATDEDNVRLLLANLRNAAPTADNYRARFRCVIALAADGKPISQHDGVIEGRIEMQRRGSGGFGYDPIFQPTKFTKTFAELSSAEKNAISHRAAALRSFGRSFRKL